METRMKAILHLADLFGLTLAGAVRGTQDWTKIRIVAAQAPVVFFDFDRVEVVTASYFRTAIMPMWTMEELGVPVLANASAECQEDIKLALEVSGQAAWHVLLGSEHRVSDPRVLGILDGELHEVLRNLMSSGSITAASIAERDQTVSRTAWNNRLAGLWRGRLLSRWKQGREHHYALPWSDEAHRG
jgi:hypothetical protein